jgi:hypothetical protein
MYGVALENLSMAVGERVARAHRPPTQRTMAKLMVGIAEMVLLKLDPFRILDQEAAEVFLSFFPSKASLEETFLEEEARPLRVVKSTVSEVRKYLKRWEARAVDHGPYYAVQHGKYKGKIVKG